MTFTVPRKVLFALGGVLVVVAAGVLGAVIAGGGDSTTTTTVVETVESENAGVAEEEAVEAEEAEEAKVSGEAGDCESLGIDSEQGKEGRCTSEGSTLVVVDKGSTLKLEELEAKLLGFEVAKTLTGEFNESRTANGVYVVLELEVTNRLHSPEYFDSGQEQTALLLGENEYTEDSEVENWAIPDSFYNQYEKLQPESPVTGTVAFDVPKKVLPDLHETGNLDIANFSDQGEEEWDPIGVIRTYK